MAANPGEWQQWQQNILAMAAPKYGGNRDGGETWGRRLRRRLQRTVGAATVMAAKIGDGDGSENWRWQRK